MEEAAQALLLKALLTKAPTAEAAEPPQPSTSSKELSAEQAPSYLKGKLD